MKLKKIDNNYFLKNRKIVVHHTHILGEQQILSKLKDNDILFFDDCLYSQYLFLQKFNVQLLKKNIKCILGFSTHIHRTTQKIIEYENSAILHDYIHKNIDFAYGGFMSIDEIKYLLKYENIFLAAHGSRHLQLNSRLYTKFKQTTLFTLDIITMCAELKTYNLSTDIFVYPYAYDDFPCSKYIVKKYNFKYIFAGYNSQRLEIENSHKIQIS